LSMIVTSQPTCTPQCFNGQGSFPLNTCYDYVYSGHTVILTISAVGIWKDKAHIIEKILWLIYVPFVALWITMSRQHYTDDVVLGLLVGSLLAI